MIRGMAPAPYPLWRYYPAWGKPPVWVAEIARVVSAARPDVDSNAAHLKSNEALAALGEGLRALGFMVEAKAGRLPRPVLFGDQGMVVKSFNVDAFRESDGISVEVEAGGAIYNNRVLFDVFKMSLAVDTRFGVVLVPQKYVTPKKEWAEPYPEAVKLFDALYANPERFKLPLEGLLLVGY